MASMFSVPTYIPDQLSGEVVAGYNVESCAPVQGGPQFNGQWTAVTGSPFTSPVNILDPNGTNLTQYRVQPIRQVTVNSTVYTLDTYWSKPFYPTTKLYDPLFSRWLLPSFRFNFLGDNGVSQTNGTVTSETTGAGNGTWVFDGTAKRFPLQFVNNDDPVRVLDDIYEMFYTSASSDIAEVLQQNQDYQVDVRNGLVEFAVAPQSGDYARFNFRRVDFVNADLLIALSEGVNALSHFGLSGYQLQYQRNLVSINCSLAHPDIGPLICMVAGYLMREGLTEAALRGSMAFRDDGVSADPYPSRALQFLVEKIQVTEASIQRAVNAFIRTTVGPRGEGEFDMFWNLTQLTPLTPGMFRQFPGSYGTMASTAGFGVPFFPWYS